MVAWTPGLQLQTQALPFLFFLSELFTESQLLSTNPGNPCMLILPANLDWYWLKYVWNEKQWMKYNYETEFTDGLWYCLDGSSQSLPGSTSWMLFLSLGCYSNHTDPHCAVYHLDRSLALERFIHLLCTKSFWWFLLPTKTLKKLACASVCLWENKLVLTGRQVHTDEAINPQVMGQEPAKTGTLTALSLDIPDRVYSCKETSLWPVWTRSKEFEFATDSWISSLVCFHSRMGDLNREWKLLYHKIKFRTYSQSLEVL